MTNAMFLALGYPLTFCTANMRTRRFMIAAEILRTVETGQLWEAVAPAEFEGSGQFAYPVLEAPGLERQEGFEGVNGELLKYCEVEVRARKGAYVGWTLEEMVEYVKGDERYGKLRGWLWEDLGELVEQVEVIDEGVRRSRGRR